MKHLKSHLKKMSDDEKEKVYKYFIPQSSLDFSEEARILGKGAMGMVVAAT